MKISGSRIFKQRRSLDDAETRTKFNFVFGPFPMQAPNKRCLRRC